MKILTTNHRYELANFENPESPGQTIQFIEKSYPKEGITIGKAFQKAVTVNDGTTNEEVLLMLIDRIRGLNEKMPCRQNSLAITKLEEALLWLNNRTAERRIREVEGTMQP
jgi:hypothetical protein